MKDRRGNALIEFLIIFPILAFMFFGMLDYWVILQKHQYAEHIMHKYLQRMQVEGYLSITDENTLITSFNTIGCPVESITGQRQSQGQSRILRNTADLNSSIVSLTITCTPVPQPFLTARFVGGNIPNNFKIRVGGSMLSERVTP